MTDPFRHLLEGLKETAEGLIAANAGIKKMADAALQAKTEHDDVRDTVHRLETLVLDQTVTVNALRRDVADLRAQLHPPTT